MGRTAYVGYGDNGFWAYDVAGSVFLWFLIQSAEEYLSGDTESWLEEAIENWRASAVVTELAHYANDGWNSRQEDLVIQLCHSATTAIRKVAEFSADDVQSWPLLGVDRIDARGHDVIPAEPVARLGDGFALLLSGKLPEPPEGHLWFYTLEPDVSAIRIKTH